MSTAGRHRRPHRGPQSGSSLVEVLVVTLVVAPVVLAASTGLFTAVRVSGDSQDRQELEAALTSFGEAVLDLPYVDCATAARVGADYAAWPSRWAPDPGSRLTAADLRVVSVEHWDQAAPGFLPTCTPGGGAQRLTLQVGSGADAVLGEYVKRDPDAAPAVTP